MGGMGRRVGAALGAVAALAIVAAGCTSGGDSAATDRTADRSRKPSRVVTSTTTMLPPPTTVATAPPAEEPPPVEEAPAPEPAPAPAPAPEPEPSRGAVLVAGTDAIVFTRREGTPGTVGSIFFVTNQGDAETGISVWGTGGRASVQSSCSGVLPPGERCQVTVSVYGPGPVNGTVFVGTPEGVVLQIPVSGEV